VDKRLLEILCSSACRSGWRPTLRRRAREPTPAATDPREEIIAMRMAKAAGLFNRCRILCLLLLALDPSAAQSQIGGPFDLRWNTIDGGGGTSNGASFVLRATAGQPDAAVATGGVFTLAGGFWHGGMAVTSVEEAAPGASPASPSKPPVTFHLYPASPNPARSSARIAFDLPDPGAVRLAVHNVQGARIKLLVLRFFPAGRHELTWDGTDQAGNPVGSGIYHIRLEAGSGVQHQKVVIVQSGP
jgi:hypothetical protein